MNTDEIRSLLELVRQGGYNDSIYEISSPDRGHDLFTKYLDVDVGVERIQTLITQKQLEAKAELRHQLANEAPAPSSEDIEEYNTFIRNIWQNWAAKNGWRIGTNGKAELTKQEEKC